MAIVLILVAAAASWFDLRKNIIPNRLVFFGAGMGVILRASWDIVNKTPFDILVMALEVTVLFFCLWPIYAVGGLGAGDCKLLLMAGMLLPVKQAFFVIAGTFFIAAIEIMFLKLIYAAGREKRRLTVIRFAPSFLLAVLGYTAGFLGGMAGF